MRAMKGKTSREELVFLLFRRVGERFIVHDGIDERQELVDALKASDKLLTLSRLKFAENCAEAFFVKLINLFDDLASFFRESDVHDAPIFGVAHTSHEFSLNQLVDGERGCRERHSHQAGDSRHALWAHEIQKIENAFLGPCHFVDEGGITWRQKDFAQHSQEKVVERCNLLNVDFHRARSDPDLLAKVHHSKAAMN